MFAQTFVFSLVTGAYLVIATLGFALVSRVEKFLNIAHAQFVAVGAFVTYFLTAKLDWSIVPAALVAMLAVGTLSMIIGRLVYSPIRHASPVVLLITSVGVLYVLQGLTEAIVTPGVYSFAIPRQQTIDLGPVSIGTYGLAIIGLALIAVVGLHFALVRTQVGLQLRAIASNERLAAVRGIDPTRTSNYVWLVAGVLAGLAGVTLGLLGALNTEIAFAQILLILTVSIVAGLGSLYGVVVAALLVGFVMDMSTLVLPAGYREMVAFCLVILILLIRREGLSKSMLRRAA